jgi:hypothetical protein
VKKYAFELYQMAGARMPICPKPRKMISYQGVAQPWESACGSLKRGRHDNIAVMKKAERAQFHDIEDWGFWL